MFLVVTLKQMRKNIVAVSKEKIAIKNWNTIADYYLCLSYLPHL
jgi:hypothetical protein